VHSVETSGAEISQAEFLSPNGRAVLVGVRHR
jgi:hypothetical protein